MNRYVARDVIVLALRRVCYPVFSRNVTVHTEGLCLSCLCRFVSISERRNRTPLCCVKLWRNEALWGQHVFRVACENPEALWLAWSRVSHDLAAAAQPYAHSQTRSMSALRGLTPTAFLRFLATGLETLWLCSICHRNVLQTSSLMKESDRKDV